MKKNKLIKITKYLSNKQPEKDNSKNEVNIEYGKLYFVNNISSY